jgi:hypothetical protein
MEWRTDAESVPASLSGFCLTDGLDEEIRAPAVAVL